MPAVMESVRKMSADEKLRLLEYLVKSLSFTVVRYNNALVGMGNRRIGSMAGKWRLPTDEEDHAMDAEIESMFECLQES